MEIEGFKATGVALNGNASYALIFFMGAFSGNHIQGIF